MCKYFCRAALVLVLALAATQPTKASDLSNREGRTAVTYEVQLDWVYPRTGQTYHTGYTVTLFYDENGTLVQTQGYNEAMADIASAQGREWKITNVDGPHYVGVTPW